MVMDAKCKVILKVPVKAVEVVVVPAVAAAVAAMEEMEEERGSRKLVVKTLESLHNR